MRGIRFDGHEWIAVEIARTTPEQVDLQATLDLILKHAVEALGASAGVVATWSEAERRFIDHASYGLDAKALTKLRPLLDEAIPDLAESSKGFSFLSELRQDAVLPSSNGGVTQNPVIVLPLRVGGKSVGLIWMLRPVEAVSFSDVDQPILAAFAEQAAIAVQQAKLVHLLAEEKQRVETILEGSADGIMSIDAQRRIVGFNSAMERMLGLSRDEVLGKQCFRVLNLESREGKAVCARQCPMLMDPEECRSNLELEGKVTSRDGQRIDVAMVYSIVRDLEGRPLNAVMNVRDTTRLREVENMRSAFLSMLGHELQTPLSIIKGYTSTLAQSDSKRDRETLLQGLITIEEESDRLSKIVNRLLLASRIEAGLHTPQRELVDLRVLAKRVVRRLQASTNIHTFDIDFEPRFPSVVADPEQMGEALTNLVDNAIKYSPSGGTIAIMGKASDGQIEITVADEGIGIAVRDLERIFERFHRVDSSLASKVQGAGLGLFICKSIIEAHGGTIWADSKLGTGSRFTFTIPIKRGGS